MIQIFDEPILIKTVNIFFMKKLCMILINMFLCFYSYSQTQVIRKMNEKGKVKEIDFTTAEVDATPIGGINNFIQWVVQNYNYPVEALENEVQGISLVSFIIEKDGSLSGFKIEKDLKYGTGEELIRILKTSKRWKPAFYKGQAVRVAFALPLRLNAKK